MARARDIHLVRPVSAPSSNVFDKIVNRAISSKNAPAPAGCSHRLTSTTRPKLMAAPATIAKTLTTEPRKTTAAIPESPAPERPAASLTGRSPEVVAVPAAAGKPGCADRARSPAHRGHWLASTGDRPVPRSPSPPEVQRAATRKN